MGVKLEFETVNFEIFDKSLLREKSERLGAKEVNCLKLVSNQCPDPIRKRCESCVFAVKDHKTFKDYLNFRRFSNVRTVQKRNPGLILETRGFAHNSSDFVYLQHNV